MEATSAASPFVTSANISSSVSPSAASAAQVSAACASSHVVTTTVGPGPASTFVDPSHTNATLSNIVPCILLYEGSIAQKLDNVSLEDVACVDGVLHDKYPRRGKYKEGLIFEVSFYVPKNIGSARERAEFVAKAIVELQRWVPIAGQPTPAFPVVVEKEYLDQVRKVLPVEGKNWVESMLQPAPDPPPDINDASPPQGQDASMADHSPPETPAESSVVPAMSMADPAMPIVDPGDMVITIPSSPPSVSDHTSDHTLHDSPAYGTTAGQGHVLIVDFSRPVVRRRFLRLWLAACFIIVLLIFLS